MSLTDWQQRQLDIETADLVPDVDYTKVPRIYWTTCLTKDASKAHGRCLAGVVYSVNGVPTKQTRCPEHGGVAVDISNAGPAEPTR